MICTTFWHANGTPMSAQQFLQLLFGKLPEFFKSEMELRFLWSAPEIRRELLEALADAGFGAAQLAEMQRIIDAAKSNLFDVLAPRTVLTVSPIGHLRSARTDGQAAFAPLTLPMPLQHPWKRQSHPVGDHQRMPFVR